MLGEDALDTVGTLMNIGVLYYEAKDYEAALVFYTQALSCQSTSLGSTHPSTLTTVMNMADTYAYIEDYEKAEDFYRKAIDGFEALNEKGSAKSCTSNLAGEKWVGVEQRGAKRRADNDAHLEIRRTTTTLVAILRLF